MYEAIILFLVLVIESFSEDLYCQSTYFGLVKISISLTLTITVQQDPIDKALSKMTTNHKL
jgi:hypothetical protein